MFDGITCYYYGRIYYVVHFPIASNERVTMVTLGGISFVMLLLIIMLSVCRFYDMISCYTATDYLGKARLWKIYNVNVTMNDLCEGYYPYYLLISGDFILQVVVTCALFLTITSPAWGLTFYLIYKFYQIGLACKFHIADTYEIYNKDLIKLI
jgi:hypothetical protein